MNGLIYEIKDLLEQKRDVFKTAEKRQIEIWNGNNTDRQPLLLTCPLNACQKERYPDYNTKETHFDSEKMLLHGLKRTLGVYNGSCDAVPSLRANMGCGIYPTMFGLRQTLFEDKMPWLLENLPKETITRMEIGDIKISDEFRAGLEHMSYMADFLKDSPCRVFPMDLQGPCDTAHLVYGNRIFYDIYDDPGFVHHLLELCTHAIIMGMEECIRLIPDSSNVIAHYNCLAIPRSRGGLKISEDTSTLLSREHIEEFVVPYTMKILEHFGGGYIHYCGKNPNLFEAFINKPLAYGINFGNPDKHDMVYILKRCAEAGKIYYGSMGKRKSDNETLAEFFTKYLNASKRDGHSFLLLGYSCDITERDKVVQAWETAQKSSGINHNTIA